MTAAGLGIRLYGYPVSNWFNIARAAMIEKGLGSAYQPCRASQEKSFLALSAMGKIPWLETPEGPIAETVAILDYLEEISPTVALLPTSPFARAQTRQLINICQIYIEVPLRALYPGVFMGGENSVEARETACTNLQRSLPAIDRIASFSPWALREFSLADLVLFYTLDLGERVLRHEFQCSVFDVIPRLRSWNIAMRDRTSTQLVLADFLPAFHAYLKDRDAVWKEPTTKETSNDKGK